MNKKGLIGNLIGGFIILIVAIALLPAITEEVEKVQNKTYQKNVTVFPANLNENGGETLFKLIPFFFILGVLGVAVGMIYSSLRSSGLFDGSDPYDLNGDGEADDNEVIEKDIKKEALYNEEETRVDQLSETKKRLENYRSKIKRFKDRMSKFEEKKIVSEEDLKKSKFD